MRQLVLRFYLQIVWQHHRQHRRYAKIRQKYYDQREHDWHWNVARWIDCLLTGCGHTIKANKTVETFCSARHHAGNTERHETTFATMHSGRYILLRYEPIRHIGCINVNWFVWIMWNSLCTSSVYALVRVYRYHISCTELHCTMQFQVQAHRRQFYRHSQSHIQTNTHATAIHEHNDWTLTYLSLCR